MVSNTSQALFNIAQTFYVDPSVVGQNQVVQVTSVDIYFKFKPPGLNNLSGMNYPGITVYLSDTIYNVPLVNANTFNNYARAEWTSISTTSDSSIPTRFVFTNPVSVKTGKLYSLLLSYDGNETFYPWTAIQGEDIVGTTTVYNSSSGNLIGNFYDYVSNGDGIASPELAQTQADYMSFWTPLLGTQMTFDVKAARYFINGNPVNTTNVPALTTVNAGVPFETDVGTSVIYRFPSLCSEAVAFNISQSTVQSYIGAQRVFQNNVFWPGGFANGGTYVSVSTISGNTIITANNQLPNGSSFNWANVYHGYTGVEYVVLMNGSTPNVRKVINIVSNTVIQVDEPVTFTNTSAAFFVSPVATIDSVFQASPFGKINGFLFLNQSNANSSIRFVNNQIISVTMSANGNGYNNSDVLYVTGFQNVAGKAIGGYIAVANIGTNTSGGIANLNFSNLGAGFVNSSLIVAVIANSTNYANQTGNTSTGTGATFNYVVGATLQTELTTNIFQNCVISNFTFSDVTPYFTIENPIGTTYSINFLTQYYANNDGSVLGNNVYYVVNPPQSFPVQLGIFNTFNTNQQPAFISYSNEFITSYANGTINDQVNSLNFISNNYQLQVDTTSNNDYSCIVITSPPAIEFGKFSINNDYSNENTNAGNAYAKHISTLTNFSRLSEDLRVFLTVYQPPNTSFQCFARIQNSSDPEAFSNEDWTRLSIIGANLASSVSQSNDYIQLEYAFTGQPNVGFTNTEILLAGTVATSNNSASITGTNTIFSNNLAVGNMIKIYDPLFPNSNFVVCTVNSIASNTSLTIDQVVTSTENPSLIQPSMYVSQILYENQAFNNIDNSNVVRYYNTSLVKFDGYNELQLKIVLLSSAFNRIPELNSIQAIGVSA